MLFRLYITFISQGHSSESYALSTLIHQHDFLCEYFPCCFALWSCKRTVCIFVLRLLLANHIL